MDRMDRRRWLQILAAAGALPLLIRDAMANGNKPIIPGFRKISGTVLLNGQQAREGMEVRPGDSIKTGSDGQAIYVIGQDAFLLRASSEVQFPMSAEAFFRLITGRMISAFGHGEKTLVLPTATIGIRGTACYAEAEATRTYFCLCFGTADITPTVAPQERITIHTRHHEHPMYIHADPHMPTSMVPAEVINHTDAELELVESLVGRVPPFVHQYFKQRY